MPHRPHPSEVDIVNRLTRRHTVVGWFGLLIFLALGIVLETLHGFKAAYYLDTRNTTRRLMWTLSHSHGTLFSLVNIVFALSLGRLDATRKTRLRVTSFGLISSLVLMPLGFFLGGLNLYSGDPGPGILLVPVGAFLLLLGVGILVVELVRNQSTTRGPKQGSGASVSGTSGTFVQDSSTKEKRSAPRDG